MRSRNPQFSICIPCFNHEGYIGQTIESVLCQSFEDFEIIVADNASTDDSLSVIRRFRDPRIRVIENRYNIGFAPNLQRVTESACGRFVNLLSSDDVMEQGTLSTYSEVIELAGCESQPAVLMAQCWQIDGEDNVTAYITRSSKSLAPKRTLIPTKQRILEQPLYDVIEGRSVYERCMAELNTAGTFCSLMYSRDLWLDVEGYNSTQIINPDMHFTLKILRRSPKVVFVNRPLYRYRRHSMGQGAIQARQRALKLQVDDYKYTLEFDTNWLEGLGTTPEDQQSQFVYRDCIKEAFMKMAAGGWLEPTRLLAFGWAAYPRHVLRQPLGWLLAFLLLLGPLGVLLAWLAWRVHRLRKPEYAPMTTCVASSDCGLLHAFTPNESGA